MITREDIIQVACRALALIQLISAAIEITYLPEKIIEVVHHPIRVSVLSVADRESYFSSLYQTGLVMLIMRIAGLLLLTLLFWNASSWICRLLLPERDENIPSEQED